MSLIFVCIQGGGNYKGGNYGHGGNYRRGGNRNNNGKGNYYRGYKGTEKNLYAALLINYLTKIFLVL